MNRLAILAVVILTATGCGHGRTIDTSALAGPDMGNVLRMSTRFGLAHACPISPTLALTAAHVVDPRPFDNSAPLWGAHWSTEFGGKGIAKPLPRMIDGSRDLAVVKGEFPAWYPIAPKAPSVGLPLYVLGYDFKTRRTALSSVRHKGTLTRIVGGQIVLDVDDPKAGSSGGCILNAQGEVVAVMSGSFTLNDQSELTAYDGLAIVGVGVWGETFEEPPEAPRVMFELLVPKP